MKYVVMRGDQIVSEHSTLAEAETARRAVYGDKVDTQSKCLCGEMVPDSYRCSCLDY